jgi:hypothetical protein
VGRVSRRRARGSTWSSTSKLGPVKRCAVLLRGGMVCAWCLCDPTPPERHPGRGLEVDHVVPRAEGGGSDPSNLVPCCGECNVMRNCGEDAFAAHLALRGVALATALAEVRRQAAIPHDVAAGKDLARAWYPWLDAYEARRREAFRRRYHARRAAAAALPAAPF